MPIVAWWIMIAETSAKDTILKNELNKWKGRKEWKLTSQMMRPFFFTVKNLKNLKGQSVTRTYLSINLIILFFYCCYNNNNNNNKK